MFQENKSGRNGRQSRKTGTEEAILCIYYMTRMEIPFHTELTTSTIITMTIITREKTADMPAMHAVPKKNARNLALLTYMLQHNEHHAAELDEMADKLEKAGMADAAKQIREGVSDFQKGNMRLSLALTLVKEHLKEVK